MRYIIDSLFHGSEFLTRDAFNKNKPIVPSKQGIYAWYFTDVPGSVPLENCHEIENKFLLYIGISPSNPNSKNNLRNRLNQHFNGNAASSTLRKSLGCLHEFQLIGDKNKKFSKEDEYKLSCWLSQNAFVKFIAVEHPWEYEKSLIQSQSLPLNLEYNQNHVFYIKLKNIRKQ